MMLSHLIRVHSSDLNFSVKCDVPECQRTFRKPRSYQSHLRRQHGDFDINSPIRARDGREVGEQWEEDEEMPMEVVEDGLVNEEGLYDNLEDGLNEKKRMDALFLLQTKEANRLTQKATDNIMAGATALVKNTVELLRMGVQNRLDSAGLRFEAVPGLTELFNDEHVISNPFRHVNTEHKQSAYFKENFNLVVSIDIRIVVSKNQPVVKS